MKKKNYEKILFPTAKWKRTQPLTANRAAANKNNEKKIPRKIVQVDRLGWRSPQNFISVAIANEK